MKREGETERAMRVLEEGNSDLRKALVIQAKFLQNFQHF